MLTRLVLCSLFIAVFSTTILVAKMTTATASEVPGETVVGDKAAQMDAFLERLVPFGFNGAALVAHKGEVILNKAYGVRDPQSGDPNTTATLFSTGSVTKQYTATAIMRLEMEGKLSTDDPITMYIDDVPTDKQAITIHHMLTHSAGFRGAYGDDHTQMDRDDYVALVMSEPLEFEPGDRYEYSNAGYSLLAVIIEKLSDMTWEEYLRTALYDPAGLSDTGLYTLDLDSKAVAHAHNAEEDYRSAGERPPNAWHLIGNGGQLATTGDLYRWYDAVRYGDVLAATQRDKLFARHIREQPDGDSYYGYGWVNVTSQRGGEVIWHNGGAMGMWSCALWEWVDDGNIFVVFANSDVDGRQPVDDIIRNLCGIMIGQDVTMPPETSFSGGDPAQSVGEYALGDGAILTVSNAGGNIVLQPDGQEAFMVLFPSLWAPMLPKYNGFTRHMVEAAGRGDFAAATERFDVRPGDDGEEMMAHFWESMSELGEFESVDVHGTRMAGSAETYATLHFADGDEEIRFHWMNGRCQGIVPAPVPTQLMYAQPDRSYKTYRLQSGESVVARFGDDGTLTITGGERELEAKRR